MLSSLSKLYAAAKVLTGASRGSSAISGLRKTQAVVCCRPRVTPQTFLAFVTLYSHQLRTRAQAATSAVQRLRTGCARLREADTQIAEMRKSMQHLQPLATAKSRVRLCWSWSAPHLLADYTMGTGYDCLTCTCTTSICYLLCP